MSGEREGKVPAFMCAAVAVIAHVLMCVAIYCFSRTHILTSALKT